MKLGKKNVIRKETLLGVGLILCLAIGLFVQKKGEWYPTQGKEAYLTGKVPSTASVVKDLDKDTLVFMIVKMRRVRGLGNSSSKF